MFCYPRPGGKTSNILHAPGNDLRKIGHGFFIVDPAHFSRSANAVTTDLQLELTVSPRADADTSLRGASHGFGCVGLHIPARVVHSGAADAEIHYLHWCLGRRLPRATINAADSEVSFVLFFPVAFISACGTQLYHLHYAPSYLVATVYVILARCHSCDGLCAGIEVGLA